MFFDNEVLYIFCIACNLRYEASVLGIMPVTNAKQIKRMITLSNAHMPQKLLACGSLKIIQAMMQAVLPMLLSNYRLDCNGIRGVHIYSMNKPIYCSDYAQYFAYRGSGKC